jgi:hypothetical protein
MKKLIGGAALVKLGSSRSTSDVDYLINDTTSKEAFIFDTANNTDYINANGNDFFKAVWNVEKNNNGEMATPQSLLELKAFAFVQHCQNRNWKKVNDTEYDMKFLVLAFGLSELKIANKHMNSGELFECMKVIKSATK